MSYVAYNIESTVFLCRCKGTRTKRHYFALEAAAKAAITREVNRGVIKAEDFAVAEAGKFGAEIERTEVVKNLMSGYLVTQSVNTPLCCDVSSETYWSM